ncbi:hypothetical protein [Alloactinosynnema sp. L-07]|uniref:substrate-binding domain-containing protein n=1 Tax=Alloactinosynnema sp. L-07 TaxID=1653480 RepID=UPI00065EFAC3|nr:substrate-binding domain-containing protein [Alloactinosynnema sp. L-07]CRK56101.1 hypothetical protein [Alloactinosynnema sp. L-07]
MTLPARVLACVLGMVVVLAGVSCTPAGERIRLRVLASPEMRDVEPLLADLRAETGIELSLEYRATVDASADIAAGGSGYDLAWLSSDKYLDLRLRAQRPPRNLPPSTAIMTSPVVIGVTGAVADKVAARGPNPTWATIADLAAAGELRFAMGDPRHSGSGLSALVGVATAAADTGQALRVEDVRCDRLSGFRTGHTVATDSSADAAERFTSPGGLDGLIATESVLLELNASGKLPEPLRIVYPADGIVLADHPLLLLDDAHHAAYEKVTTWLRAESAQRWIMDNTARRPINPDVPRSDRLARSVGTALYYPDDLDVIKTLLDNYGQPGHGDPARRHVVFVLDYSGSMRGDRIAELRAAFNELTGAGESSFVRFHQGERMSVLKFADGVLDQREFAVAGEQDMAALRDMIAVENFGDHTAIWSAVGAAYDIGVKVRAARPGTQVSVVLMTDGLNNAGDTADAFLAARQARGPVGPLFPILFGDADAAELSRVATATGGSMIDATAGSLADAFKESRGCF